MTQMKPKVKKGMLTERKLNELAGRVFKDFDPNECVIKWWQYPLLWCLWLLKGAIIIRDDSWIIRIVEFRGVRYLLTLKEANQW